MAKAYRIAQDVDLPLPTAVWVLGAHAYALLVPLVLVVAVTHHWTELVSLTAFPILFYVAVMLAVLLLIQDSLLVRLAWGFVIMRVIHSLVHCSYNRVMHRFVAYFISCLFLLLLWVRLASYLIMN